MIRGLSALDLLLSDRRKALEADLPRAADIVPLRFHPRMADTYREQVQALITDLGKFSELQTAQEALRGLVERLPACFRGACFAAYPERRKPP